MELKKLFSFFVDAFISTLNTNNHCVLTSFLNDFEKLNTRETGKLRSSVTEKSFFPNSRKCLS